MSCLYKTCKQCGEVKPTVQYRPYYGGRTGTYSMCKDCEKINSRVKYLDRKKIMTGLTENEVLELTTLYELYDVQRAAGLRPPVKKILLTTGNAIDALRTTIESYAEVSMLPAAVLAMPVDTPAELQKWLTVELDEEPEHYQDTIYDGLVKIYRPVLRVNPDTLLPEYDETYSVVLNMILERFNRYEDVYYK